MYTCVYTNIHSMWRDVSSFCWFLAQVATVAGSPIREASAKVLELSSVAFKCKLTRS